MKITDVHVDNFGAWRDLAIRDLPDQMAVFYGPNEAGKTTLLEFVRTVLYGFTADRCGRYVPPFHFDGETAGSGLRVGGKLRVSTPEGDYWLTRRASASNPLGEPGPLRVTSDDGTRQGGRLESLLSGIDETIFNNVFALGLTELQHLSALQDTEAARQLYSLSAGVDRVSLADVMRELQGARDRILAAGDGPSLVGDLWSLREKHAREIQELASQADLWSESHLRLESLAQQISRLEQERDQLTRRSQAIQLALSVYPQWVQRRELSAELARLGDLTELPDGLLQRLHSVRRKLEERQQRFEELKQKRQHLRKAAGALPWNEPLWRQSARISVLADQQGWMRSLDHQVRALNTQVEELEFEIQAEQENLGLGPDDSASAAPAVGPNTLAALRRPAQAVRRAHKRHRRARRDADARHQETLHFDEQIAAVLSQDEALLRSHTETDLVRVIEETGSLASSLRRRVQLDDVLGQLELHLQELESRRDHLIQRQILPVSVLAGLAGLFVLGFVLLLTGVFGGLFSIGQPNRILLTIVGAAAASAAVVMKKLLERSAVDQLESCERQCDLIASQADNAREECARLEEEIPTGDGELADRLEDTECRLEILERLLPIEAQRRTTAEQAQAAERLAKEAMAEVQSSRKRWRAALRGVGLSEQLTPKQIRQLCDRAGTLAHLRTRLEDVQRQQEHRRRELVSVQSQVAKLASEVGVALDESAGPVEQLQQLLDAAKHQDQIADQRQACRRQLRQLRREQEKLHRSIRRLQRQRRSMVEVTGAADEDELQRLDEQWARRRRIEQHRDALSREIESARSGRVTQEDIGREIDEADAGDLNDRMSRINGQIDAIAAQLQDLHHRRGELTQRIRSLQSDRQLAAKQLDQVRVQEQLHRGVERWKVLAATGRMLETVYRRYEADRQPETLQEASEYLHRFTEGRYTRVWTPLSEEALRVDPSDGHSMPIEMLSRGTREQVFLSLRLALVTAYARRGVRMPMVLDDVLVNFDADRARAAAEVLCDFAASGIQLLIFTCHNHVRQIFEQLGVPSRELPRHEDCRAAAAEVSAPQRSTSRRRRKTPKTSARAKDALASVAAANDPTPAARPFEQEPDNEPDQPGGRDADHGNGKAARRSAPKRTKAKARPNKTERKKNGKKKTTTPIDDVNADQPELDDESEYESAAHDMIDEPPWESSVVDDDEQIWADDDEETLEEEGDEYDDVVDDEADEDWNENDRVDEEDGEELDTEWEEDEDDESDVWYEDDDDVTDEDEDDITDEDEDDITDEDEDDVTDEDEDDVTDEDEDDVTDEDEDDDELEVEAA